MAKYPGVMSPIAKQPKPSLRDKLIPPPGAPGEGGGANWMGGSSGAGGAGYAPGGGGYAGGMPDIFKSPGDKGGGSPLGPFVNAPGGGTALPDMGKKPPANGLFGGLTKPIGMQPGGASGVGGITSSPIVDKEPNFWNAERMKAAQPMASNLPDTGGGVPAGVPQPANMPTAAAGPVNRQLAAPTPTTAPTTAPTAPTNAPLTGGGTYNRRAAGDPTVGLRRPQSPMTPEQRANYATTHYGQGTQHYANDLTNATRRASPEYQARIAGNAGGIARMQQRNAALAAAAADPHRTAWYQQLHDMGGAAGGALPWEEYARQQGWDTNRNFGYYGQHGATSDQQGGYTDSLGIWRTGPPPAPLTPPPARTGGAVDENGNVTNLPPFDPTLNVNQAPVPPWADPSFNRDNWQGPPTSTGPPQGSQLGPLFDNGPIMQQVQQSPYYGQLMQLLMQLFGGGIA